MSTPSNQEQLLLEFINQTRLDPAGSAFHYISSYSPLVASDPDIQSALSYFGVSGAALESGFAALAPTQPLAWNGSLGKAARAHSQMMISHDQQSHQLPGEAGLGARLMNAGYNYSSAGENIYAYAESMLYAHAGFMVDWGYGPDGMQDPPGHRVNIMKTGFREVGLGVLAESNAATDVGPYVVTQDFSIRLESPQVFLLGVSYADDDSDRFYSVGEGRANMSITTSEASTQSTSSGGYVLELTAGIKTITFAGGGLTTPIVVSAQLPSGTNAKMDVRDASTLLTSVDLTLVSGATRLVALGVQDLSLKGAAGHQVLDGNRGINLLSGLGGNDTLNGGAGPDIMKGGTGNDTYQVGNAGDIVVEMLGGGTDLVQTAITYSLIDTDGSGANGGNVEHLTLTGHQSIHGTGNNLANTLIGNDASNRLWGNQGHDRLLGNHGDDRLYGGSGNDTLQGGSHDDVLAGGTGHDRLTGNAGADRFIFNTTLNAASNVDTLLDFVSGMDSILLDDDIFRALGTVTSTSPLAAGKFYKAAGATAAHDGNDRIIYNPSTGALFYDADGQGGVEAVQFAQLGHSVHPGLTAGDILVVV